MKNIKAVIFDFDGTLADSLHVWRQIDINYFQRHGFEFNPEKISFGGKSFSECATYVKELLNIEDDEETIKSEWIQIASSLYQNEVNLKPYAKPFIEALTNSGIKIGMATSNNQDILIPFLRKNGILDYFTSIITCCEAGKGKPAPDVYQHTAREIGVSPDECIAFEDTCEGVLSAKNAGMYVYAVADDAHIKYSDTIKENADKYIEGFSHFKWGLSSIKQFIFNDINSI